MAFESILGQNTARGSKLTRIEIDVLTRSESVRVLWLIGAMAVAV